MWLLFISKALVKIGDVLRIGGDLVEAKRRYEGSLEILRQLAAKEPSESEWYAEVQLD